MNLEDEARQMREIQKDYTWAFIVIAALLAAAVTTYFWP